MKDGERVLRKMQRILSTPYHDRRRRFGRAWAWQLTNGREIIREEFPDLVPAMHKIFMESGPRTVDDLVVVAP